MFEFWSWIGTITLIRLAYQDYTNDMYVDDRKNYFMLGLSVSVAALSTTPILHRIAVVFTAGFLWWVMGKLELLGEADIKTLSWAWLGFGWMGIENLLIFTLVFCTAMLLAILIKQYVFRYEKPVPLYGVLVLVFFSTCLWMGLY